jgi:hypothetical protein
MYHGSVITVLFLELILFPLNFAPFLYPNIDKKIETNNKIKINPLKKTKKNTKNFENRALI